MKKYLTSIVLILCVTGFAHGQTIRYVTPSGAGLFNGSDWLNAYDNTQLQTAIDAEGVTEVWVAKRTYTISVYIIVQIVFEKT